MEAATWRSGTGSSRADELMLMLLRPVLMPLVHLVLTAGLLMLGHLPLLTGTADAEARGCGA